MSDPHAREYAAAAHGMAEMYGQTPQPPRRLPSLGQRVSGTTAGRAFAGEVIAVFDAAGTVDLEIDGAWLAAVPVGDLREWT